MIFISILTKNLPGLKNKKSYPINATKHQGKIVADVKGKKGVKKGKPLHTKHFSHARTPGNTGSYSWPAICLLPFALPHALVLEAAKDLRVVDDVARVMDCNRHAGTAIFAGRE
jgi:hypothetical protein